MGVKDKKSHSHIRRSMIDPEFVDGNNGIAGPFAAGPVRHAHRLDMNLVEHFAPSASHAVTI